LPRQRVPEVIGYHGLKGSTLGVAAVLLASLVSCAALGQTYTISTFAGSAPQANVLATSAALGTPISVAVDSAGNLFFCVQSAVMRVDFQTGILTVVAGNGTKGFSGDSGPATSAALNEPGGVAVDSAGNVYIADSYNNRVREVSHGVITTVAGGGLNGLGDDGPAVGAELDVPNGVAVDSAGNLYIADTFNSRIRRVSSGVITTVAGNGTFAFSGDNGPATAAALYLPEGVAVDSAGNLYIADYGNDRVRMVSNGTITTVAGTGKEGCCGDEGPATGAELDGPVAVAVDSAGNLYIADIFNNRIREVSNGVINTLAGNGIAGSSGDNGAAMAAELDFPYGVAVDPAGNAYIADYADSRIRKVSGGIITTVAGSAEFGFSGDNGPVTTAQFFQPFGLSFDSAGNAYIADYGEARVRKLSNGIVTPVAGSETTGFGGDNGPATSALLSQPSDTAVDSLGNIYIADGPNNRIRKVSNGVITTVAGSGPVGLLNNVFSGDNGPATSARLSDPSGVALDSLGNLYIADAGNGRVRVVSNGIITTVAGGINGGSVFGSGGDNGPAVGAELIFPTAIALDSAGNLFIADRDRCCVRKVSNGIITTVAGNVSVLPGFSGDNGPATSAQLYGSTGVAVDAAGNLYIADTANQRVRKVSNGVITTIAGNGLTGFSGDGGPALVGELNNPTGVVVDSAGNVYVADSNNNRVRMLTPAPAPPPAIASVTNAFGGSSTIAPNTWVTIYGSGLAPPGDSRIWRATDFSDSILLNQLPTALDAVSVTMNGESAYIYYISPVQLNVLTPPDLMTGSIQVHVIANGRTSAQVTVQSQTISPSFFVFDGAHVVGTHLNGTDIGPTTLYPGLTTPAQPGEQVVLYVNGFGATNPPVVNGSSSQHGALPALPTVQIGGATATVEFAGLISPGLYQLNVIVPATAASGDNTLTAQYNGQSTQSGVLLTVLSNNP
jgi:uncharacterized protein (TIGR03437 family)